MTCFVCPLSTFRIVNRVLKFMTNHSWAKYRPFRFAIVTSLLAALLVVAAYVYERSGDHGTDSTPLVPIQQLLLELENTDHQQEINIVYQIGRHGKEGAPCVEALHQAYNRNMMSWNWDDPIYHKTLQAAVHRIHGSSYPLNEISETWLPEWIKSHPALAKERGLIH
jgi:hypothetical protein